MSKPATSWSLDICQPIAAATTIESGHSTRAIALHLAVVMRQYPIAKMKHLAKTAKCLKMFWVARAGS
ncbi:hypothetical protein H6G52_10565 [Limnothrix sp. FACHB-881]|uniref:hypothetical protein n=1 Tax=Limnothrix sp. FACHB-881 TaxID=2692819 RepID=UPI00168A0F35|nr:hypothetical protein [Limnothrix sp. FACHB-881]MBD2635801.1 hypothetical protein [Limnothrix sp. FACHB-881]